MPRLGLQGCLFLYATVSCVCRIVDPSAETVGTAACMVVRSWKTEQILSSPGGYGKIQSQ